MESGMPELELVIRGGFVVVAADVAVADIGVSNGTIVAVEPEISGVVRTEIDAEGLHVFPGVIDAHVHFNEPGRADWEGWWSGSRALAAGGGTTCFEMPLNAIPPTTTVGAFRAKRQAAEASSIVDFGLWGGIVPGNVAELEGLAEAGVLGLKAFMSRSGTEEFAAADDLTLYEAMVVCARLGRVVAVHAENDVMTASLAARAIAQGRTGVRDYLDARPVIAEVEAINRAILLAEEAGCPLHIVHVSSGKGVALVAEARKRGVDVTCETCPHYLVFTTEDVERLGAIAKCAPPIRDTDEREVLWEAIRAGKISMVTSDHSPAPASMKTGPDFFAIWGGISGCQSTLAAMLSEGVHERGVSPIRVSELLAGNVAKRFGLTRKGWIGVGADADICLVRLDEEYRLEAGEVHYRHPHSPYLDRRFRGRVRRTILRGRTIFADGILAEAGGGRLIVPESRSRSASQALD